MTSDSYCHANRIRGSILEQNISPQKPKLENAVGMQSLMVNKSLISHSSFDKSPVAYSVHPKTTQITQKPILKNIAAIQLRTHHESLISNPNPKANTKRKASG